MDYAQLAVLRKMTYQGMHLDAAIMFAINALMIMNRCKIGVKFVLHTFVTGLAALLRETKCLWITKTSPVKEATRTGTQRVQVRSARSQENQTDMTIRAPWQCLMNQSTEIYVAFLAENIHIKSGL
jgi:hypothetical protein